MLIVTVVYQGSDPHKYGKAEQYECTNISTSNLTIQLHKTIGGLTVLMTKDWYIQSVEVKS